MPTAATAGAISQTSGWPELTCVSAPAVRTTAVAISHGNSSDGAVSSARARPGDFSSRVAVRSSRPGWRRQTCAATLVQTRSRSTSSGAVIAHLLVLARRRAERGAQQATGPVRPALHGAFRDAHQLRYLRDRPVFDVEQAPDLTFR